MNDTSAPKPPVVLNERCPVCHGDGWIELGMNDVGIGRGRPCAYCAGRGYVATEQGEV